MKTFVSSLSKLAWLAVAVTVSTASAAGFGSGGFGGGGAGMSHGMSSAPRMSSLGSNNFSSNLRSNNMLSNNTLSNHKFSNNSFSANVLKSNSLPQTSAMSSLRTNITPRNLTAVKPQFNQVKPLDLNRLNANLATKKIDPKFSTNITHTSPLLQGSKLGVTNRLSNVNLFVNKNTPNVLTKNVAKPSFDRLINGNAAQKLQLGHQFKLREQGVVARKLDLGKKLHENGDWDHRHMGPVSSHYKSNCFKHSYCGPHCYPGFCWFPQWCGWVNWCWGNDCPGVIYNPCGPWVVWNTYPVWQPLPAGPCGTWVDVPPVAMGPSVDLQLLAVRFVDPGHPEQKLGPRFRVWVRNNSNVPVTQPFNVHAMAANSPAPVSNMPEMGVRVPSIDAGETKQIDIRLPIEANLIGRDAEGNPAPFSNLHVLVDSGREIPEAQEVNNGANIDRGQILPVDPSLFATDNASAPSGSTITLAGEGLGPEAGQVLLNLSGLELQGEIEGWHDLGVRVKLPPLALASPTDATLVVVRGDGAASNPLNIKIGAPALAGVTALNAENP